MRALAKSIKLHFAGSAAGISTLVNGPSMHMWTQDFDTAWASLRTHEKLTWIMFIGNTVAILTLIEVLVLHK